MSTSPIPEAPMGNFGCCRAAVIDCEPRLCQADYEIGLVQQIGLEYKTQLPIFLPICPSCFLFFIGTWTGTNSAEPEPKQCPIDTFQENRLAVSINLWDDAAVGTGMSSCYAAHETHYDLTAKGVSALLWSVRQATQHKAQDEWTISLKRNAVFYVSRLGFCQCLSYTIIYHRYRNCCRFRSLVDIVDQFLFQGETFNLSRATLISNWVMLTPSPEQRTYLYW